MTAKKIGQGNIIGQQGINLIERIVLEMGFTWNQSGGVEAGIDGYIEIRDPTTSTVFNSIILVQSKATKNPFQAETSEGFDWLCDARDLDYWLQGNAPVILIVSRPSSNEAYWVSIKDYFNDLTRRKARKVHFDKHQNCFDKSCASQLAEIAIPSTAGVYLSPSLKKETLWSNLLEVTSFAPKLYVASTDLRFPSEVWSVFREMGERVGGEWLLKNKQIMSFHNLEEYPWREVCDPGTLEPFDASEWAFSDDSDKKREFVLLLNKALREKVREDLRFDKKRECYYFKATPDLSQRPFSYQSLTRRSTKTVFQGYPNKKYPDRIAYYRHLAFNGKFLRFDDAWYLEISPTYHFTFDGYRPDRWYEQRLKGIKQLERNPHVLAQVLLWADYLGKQPDLFTIPYPFLTFGQLHKFDLETGIEDKLWLSHEEDEQTKAAEQVLSEGTLFADEA